MDARPPPLRPSFRCSLGWHAPQKGALWNQGYYFTRCARCGADLVRTTFSGWEAPRGQRVVWRTRAEIEQVEQSPNLPAASRPAAALPPAPARQRTVAPLNTLSRSAPRRSTISQVASVIPDFMDDPPPPSRPSEAPLRPPAGDRARR